MSEPFAMLDLANAPDDPFEPDMGTHKFRFVKYSTSPGKKNPKEMYFKFRFDQDGEKTKNWGPMVVDPLTCDDEDRRTRATSDLKRILRGVGYPISDLNEVYAELHQGNARPMEDKFGTEVIITLRKSGDFINVQSIVPEADAPDGVRGVAPVTPEGKPDLSGLAAFASGGEL